MTETELKTCSRKLMRENAPGIFFISLLYVIIISVLTQLASKLPGTVDIENMYRRISDGEMLSITIMYDNFRPAGVFFALFLQLLRPVLDMGYMSYCIKTWRGQDTEYKDIFNGFQYAFKCLAIFLITSFLILLWSILLIIPGIVAAYRYRQAYYILLDDPSKGIMQCIDESVLMMRGGKMDLFILDVTFIGWVLLDLLVMLVSPLPYTPPAVMIWLAPYRGLAYAGFFNNRRNVLTV